MFGLIRKKRQLPETAEAASPVQKSMQGKYFIGQTETLVISGLQEHAWGGLFNPASSGVNLFVDRYTLSNLSGQYVHAETWFNAKLPGRGTESPHVHPANLTLEPLPQPQAKLQYAAQITGVPLGGVNVYNRMVSPSTTFASEPIKGGVIIPPGGSFGFFLKSPGPFRYTFRIGFGWWEEPAGAGGSS